MAGTVIFSDLYLSEATSKMNGCIFARRIFLLLTFFLLFAPFSSMAVSKSNKAGSPNQKAFTDPTTGIEFVLVQGGCFRMGDKNGREDATPEHKVCVGSFSIGKYEVTQEQWKKVMDWNPSAFRQCGPNCPVTNVSWEDAQDFIAKLNAKGGKHYRLPTEAEWEYAARSRGKKEVYSGGNKIDAVAWYQDNSGKTIHPVGQKRPNGQGLYDMSGDVWQWVSDWYDVTYYGKSPMKNPQGPATGSGRVVRGGSWNDEEWFAQTSTREAKDPRFRGFQTGLRLAVSVE